MTAPIEVERPGGDGLWAPVTPETRETQEWVVQADDDPLIVRGLD
ncbi:hypothetical protein [Lentzea indica]|jgi:hypothetical protein|nr:hypothetical protein [Lentzea indica]